MDKKSKQKVINAKKRVSTYVIVLVSETNNPEKKNKTRLFKF